MLRFETRSVGHPCGVLMGGWAGRGGAALLRAQQHSKVKRAAWLPGQAAPVIRALMVSPLAKCALASRSATSGNMPACRGEGIGRPDKATEATTV